MVCVRKGGESLCGRKAGKKEGGFTLIEVMSAMFLFAVGMLALAALLINGGRSVRLGGASSRAYSLLQQQMEKIVSADFDSPHLADANPGNNATLRSTSDWDYIDVDAYGNTLHAEGYRVICNVADDTPVPDTKTLVMTVVWDRGKRLRQVVFIKSKPGPPRKEIL